MVVNFSPPYTKSGCTRETFKASPRADIARIFLTSPFAMESCRRYRSGSGWPKGSLPQERGPVLSLCAGREIKCVVRAIDYPPGQAIGRIRPC
jgi:hypothetical protein